MGISDRVLKARMTEIGRIKIGGLDETVRESNGKKWQAPKKFDHFLITGMDKDKNNNFTKDEAIHKIIGQTPKDIKIRLLYNDIDLNFRTELALYQGKTCACRGDGNSAQQLDQATGELVTVSCPCDKLDAKNGCKPHGTLNCLLDAAMQCGGVYKFSTTGWNTISGITSSLKFIQICTGGKIAGLPLNLKYFKKATTTPDGKPTVIPVVTITYEGNAVQMLESAIQNEKQRISAGIYLETLEVQVRREMKALETVTGPLDESEIAEFYPEVEEQEETATVQHKSIGQAIAESDVKQPDLKPEVKTEPKAEPKKTKPAAVPATVPATTPTTTATAVPATTPEVKTPTPEPKPIVKRHGYCKICRFVIEQAALPAVCKCGSTEIIESASAEAAQKAAGVNNFPIDATTKPAETTPTTETKPATTPAAIPTGTRVEMQKEITTLRAKLRIQTTEWTDLLKSVGIVELNAVKWTDEQAAKALQALKAKAV